MEHPASDPQQSYDEVAEEYVERIADELAHKPLDCELLAQFAARAGELGPVCDLGCGPGHVARYLHDCGADVFGIDLSPRMVEQARRLNPDIEFRQGNMLALDLADQSLGGIVAFYSLIHIPREKLIAALLELNRVLRPRGLLLLAFHIGQETLHLDQWWGKQVSVDFFFFERDEMAGWLKAAGFEIAMSLERPPYEDFEHPSRRAYFLARKPE
jgi:SAM-dependent methyltransferase